MSSRISTTAPGICGAIVSMTSSYASTSIGLLKRMKNGCKGGQSPPYQPQPYSSTLRGAYVRKTKVWASSVRRGPSAEGVPGPTTTRTVTSGSNGSTGRKAIQRPSSAAAASLLTCSSAAISASVARRIATGWSSAATEMVGSTAAGSMRWSKAMKINGSSGCGVSSPGYVVCKRGAGVPKRNCTVSASAPPVCERVPAGMVTVNSVAIGRRSISAESN